MKRDGFLIAILAGILLLVAASVGLFYLRLGTQAYLPEDSPEAVVHNYALALLEEDFQKAYSYLADKEYKPTLAQFSSDLAGASTSFVLDVGRVQRSGAEATIDVDFLDTGYGLGYPSTDYAHLLLQDGQWKLDQMPYALWGYMWYQPPEDVR